jgi:predicted chitinase
MISSNFYTGVVENRDDPLKLGRCQVRIVGCHTENKSQLPTADLPWAMPVQSITSASMNGIGWTPVGPVNGTWVLIAFTDTDQQQPIMLGTLGGIPQSKAATIATEESDSDMIATDGGILVDSSGAEVTNASGIPVTVGTADAQAKPPSTAKSTSEADVPNLTEQKTPNKPADTVLKQDITTDPPKGSTANPTIAKQNIKYLLDACDKVGLTSKYAKCAILGICGGESSWLCIEEGSYYTKASSLSAIFKRSFPTEESAQPYVKWQGSKADFFRKVYSPDGNGKLVGHKDPDDGAKYYGRGFNQITGKSLYLQLQKYLATKGVVVDFVNKPQSLVEDPATSALATAAFYAINVKHDQNDPGYFVAALKRTGADANGTGYAKKQKFYEYFLGAAVAVDSTNKPSADDQKVYTKEEVKDLPPAKQAALLEDRSDSNNIGFKDPKGKYPLRNLLDEPDTNRLARGVIKETAIEFKDSVRTIAIPAANGDDSWDQPLAPFGGMYPYAKVLETESGHLFVLDDTPENETLSLYHKQGTFLDIDANGTQVNKIVGDGYTIIDRNGSIFIAGKANLTVGNGVNILVQGTADIQVDGYATVNLQNNADIGVGGDLNLAVGGNFKVQAGGSIDFKTEAKFGIEAATTITNKAGTSFGLTAGENISMKATGKFYADSAGDTHIHAAGAVYNTAGGDNHIRAGGNINVDGTQFHGQEGAAGTADGAPAVEANTVALTYLDFSEGRSNQFNYLTTPVRPSPPVQLKYAIEEENNALSADFIANPDKYKNPEAAEGGVKENYPGTPKDDGQGKSLIATNTTGDIFLFLQKQLQLAQSGYWSETGMGGAVSNANITRIWADLGYPKSGLWTTDQTAWCMGFVNWTLKQCGYRYVQTASAAEITTNPGRWSATKLSSFAEAQPGDIAFWRYRHVNFVYSNKNGKLTFVGGNQADKAANNPSGGTVNNSWPSGTTDGGGTLVAIYRPSKA